MRHFFGDAAYQIASQATNPKHRSEWIRKVVKRLMKIVNEDTNVMGYMSSIGAGGSTVSGNSGRIFMHLKPRSGRAHVDQVLQELRRKFARA